MSLSVCHSSSCIFSAVLFVRRTIRTAKPFDILLKVSFGDGCKCLYAEIKIPVDFQASTDCFEGDKDSIFQNLRDRAMKDPSCGQTALVEKKAILVPKSEIMVHSIVTDIVEFGQDCPRLLERKIGDANEIKITRKRSRSRKRSSHRQ